MTNTLITSEDNEIEKLDEIMVTTIMCTVSFVHTVRTQGFAPFIVVEGRRGENVKISASQISNKGRIDKFLEDRELQGLCRLSWISEQELNKEYSEWLRAQKRWKYSLINDPSDIEWLDNICGLALRERVVWNKRDKNAFIDVNAAMKAETAFKMRSDRASLMEGITHCQKNSYAPEETAEYMKAVYEKHVQAIEVRALPLLDKPKETGNE